MKSNFKFLLTGGLALAILSFNACKDEEKIDPDEVSYEAANGIDGGKLYDKFWADETSFEGPTDPSVAIADIEGFADFYRCKQCHGWDLMGNTGSYAGRKPNVTRPSVAGGIGDFAAAAKPRALFDAIKNTGGAKVDPARTADGANAALGGNEHPDYGLILTDAQIWNLAKFLKEEAMDVAHLYDFTVTGAYPNGTVAYSNIGKDGNAANGKAIYAQTCASTSCHGANGTGPILAEDLTVGKFVRSKPNEAHHKIKFGQLGSVMSGYPDLTAQELKDLYAALSDTAAFPD